MDKFWSILNKRLDLCKRALMCRHYRLKGTPSDVAPILWQNGALARLKKGETIDKLLYGGYSTISLGYAGLCECTYYMKGVTHTNPEGTEFALKVMIHVRDGQQRLILISHFMEHRLSQQLISFQNVYRRDLVRLLV